MFSVILKLIKVNFVFLLLAASIVVAGQIDEGDIPEILIDPCGTSCQFKYVDVDTCWPGNTVEMPVHVLNTSPLIRMEFTLDCPTGFTFKGLNTSGTPWSPDSIDIDTIAGVIYIDFKGGSDTLEYSASYRRLVDVKLKAATSVNFGTVDTVDFEEPPRAKVTGSEDDCIVDSAFSGQITVPDDSVVVIIGPQTVYSYQGKATDDSCKDDYPVTIPISLYTNFPCSTYSLIIDKQMTTWSYVYDDVAFDTVYEAGCTFTPLCIGYWIKLSGKPVENMGNNYTLNLGNLKLKALDFASSYNADSSFSDTFYVSLKANYLSHYTYVFNWGDDESLAFDDIHSDSAEMIFPQYGIEFEAQDAIVDANGKVIVPITLDPTFYAADYNIWVNYNHNFMTLDSIVAAGGQYPEIDTAWRTIDADPPRTHYQIKSDSLFQEAKYFLPDSQQTAFNMHFTVTDSFTYTDTMTIDFTDTSVAFVYDWFSVNNPASKIRRDFGDGEFWDTTSGIVTNPVSAYQHAASWEPDTNTIILIKIRIDSLGGTAAYGGECCIWWYDEGTVNADSITSDVMTIDSLRWEETVYVAGDGYMYRIWFNENDSLTAPSDYLNIWITDTEGVFSLHDDCCIDYESGAGSVEIQNVGGDLTYQWSSPRLSVPKPISFTLSQNYPNPFNAQTKISFNMAKPGFAELKIFDILGRQIKSLVSEELSAGEHIVNWDGSNAAGNPTAAGIYFYVLKSGDFREAKKMLYLK